MIRILGWRSLPFSISLIQFPKLSINPNATISQNEKKKIWIEFNSLELMIQIMKKSKMAETIPIYLKISNGKSIKVHNH
jgi:hypothetical protein